MLRRRRGPTSREKRWVVNLSNQELSTRQQSVLSKGLSFAPASKKILIPTIVAAVEDRLRRVHEPAERCTAIRARLISTLKRARLLPSNITPEERHALGELKANKDSVIFPADKGRATVLMECSTYDDKMASLLSDRSKYKVLRRDPASALQHNMNSTLSQLKKKGSLPPPMYKRLRCPSGSTPLIYGLPKIHKPGVPLRPVVTFYTSPTYQLSKFLVKLLSPLTGSTSSFVHNSRDFVSFVHSVSLDSDEILFFLCGLIVHQNPS